RGKLFFKIVLASELKKNGVPQPRDKIVVENGLVYDTSTWAYD
ncbi:hypothetical protein TNCT_637721, partial [Trichonephila clavata]